MNNTKLLPLAVGWAVLFGSSLASAQQPSTIQAQKVTMADELTIATAWEAFAVDHNSYTPLDAKSGITSNGRGPGTELHWPNYVQVTFDFMRSMLEPTYIRILPRNDAWGNPYQFAVHIVNGASDQYVVRSLGSDGKVDGDGSYTMGGTSSPEADIVYADGAFVAYPKGISLAPTERPIAELNALKPVDHVVALLEGTGYKYSKVSENMWQFQFSAKSVPSLDVYSYYVEDVLAVIVYIGDKKQVKLDRENLLLLLRYSAEVDSAKPVLMKDDQIALRVECPLRVVDEAQFSYMLTQVTRGADDLLAKLIPKPHQGAAL